MLGSSISLLEIMPPLSTLKRIKHLCCAAATALTLGCASTAISPQASAPAPVDSWARDAVSGEVVLNWLPELADANVEALLSEALAQNFQLAEQRIRLEESRQSAIVAGADRWPTLSAGVDATRRGSNTLGVSDVTATQYGLNANLNWELDVWGQLSAAARAASLDYEAAVTSYEAARRDLVADAVASVYDTVNANQLLALFKRNLSNLLADYDIVDGSYRRGLNSALDVYLAQTSIERQREAIANQHQLAMESTAAVQLLLARYPDGRLELPDTLPLLTEPIPAGLPSELLARRQDIRAAWYSLLAADARLAVAHKNRFPRLALSATGGNASAGLGDLLDGDARSWSIAANLTRPLFDGGRLRAAEAQARARTEALEQQYLDLVYRAFADVENAISRTSSLQARYAALNEASRNANAALELAFEQYQRGLVTYTTVLESQRRAFDSETSLVRLQNQLIQNRVTLYRALGGEFLLDE
jgi:multidrug efflux system outer membrane protein